MTIHNEDLYLKKIKQKARIRKQEKKRKVSPKSGTLSRQKKLSEIHAQRSKKAKVKVTFKSF